jgi:hypothetical protein
MASFKKEGETDEVETSPLPSGTIDATTEAGVSQLAGMGLPVRVMRT